MVKKTVFYAFSVLMILSLLMAACTPTTVVETQVVEVEKEVVETVEVEVEKEVITTVEVEKIVEVVATPEPSMRTGAWLDTVTMVADPSVQSAVTRLIAGDIDVYAQSSSNAEAFKTATDAGLASVNSYGSYNELTMNTYGPVFEESTGGLNPFAVREIREAMNMLLDRDYIVQEIMGGLAINKFFPITGGFPDYALYVDVARELEAKYAYNMDMATEIITAEMEELGAVKDAAGKWTFNDEPVTLIFLIRVEDERRQIGDYISNQLEAIGFTVDRQYKTSSEASVLWVQGNVADGLWHLYTGGWITTAVDRDQGSNFEFFLSPKSAYSFTTLWQNYVVSEEADVVYTALANNSFTTLDERRELFAEALRFGIEESQRVWLVDRLSYSPYNAAVEVGADLAGGISGSSIAPYTLRYADVEGGDLTYAMADVLTEPWNGLAGSNWIYDSVPRGFTEDAGVLVDPYTGLQLPQRIERAEVVVEEGLPVGQTLDWVTFSFAPTIEVPAEAWVDWDGANQTFITAGEKFPDGATAKVKSTVYYPADFFDTVTWHDGSPISVADFVMAMAMGLDVGKEGSAIYDESQAATIEANLEAFKGWNIISTDPLTIEWYSDNYSLDAENNVATMWPEYGFGNGAWHNMAVAYKAAATGELAFSADKADADEVEWMSLISGPSLDILRAKLTEAKDETFIPYANVMAEYLTAEEAAARYANLETWYRTQGHFWVGTGPYYLNKVFPVEKTLSLTRYQEFPDSANKWARFSAPAIPVVELDGPGRVDIGTEAAFDVYVTFEDAPYAQADISEVKYLVFDANGALSATGVATAVADGQYQVVLGADVTNALAAGSNKLEVAVLSKLVSLPAFAAFEFVTAAP
jgi:peptide/nickel transport system substrate-binding protein